MALNKDHRVLLLGGNSDIGNEILKATKIGENSQRIYFSRGKPSVNFRHQDVQVKFDAINLPQAVKDLEETLIQYEIDCVIFSYATLDFKNLDSILNSNIVNFNSQIALAEIVIQHFIEQKKKTGKSGKVIFISSSIISLKPRRKNFRYTATKIASDFYLNGLRQELQVKKAGIKIIVIRPGFTKTKIHYNEKPGPFSTTPNRIGKSVNFQLLLGLNTIYSPFFIIIPIFILSLLPSKLLNWLDARSHQEIEFD